MRIICNYAYKVISIVLGYSEHLLHGSYYMQLECAFRAHHLNPKFI